MKEPIVDVSLEAFVKMGSISMHRRIEIVARYAVVVVVRVLGNIDEVIFEFIECLC